MIRSALDMLRAAWLFRGCRTGARVRAAQNVRVAGARSGISLGDRVQFWDGVIPQELLCEEGAEISVGERTAFNYGVSLRAARSVRIGRNCLFGSLVIVHDRSRARTAPIVIGDDVWIAHGAVIEPGVTVGDGSVVGAGSVVTADVPPRSLAVGNPARCTPLPAQ